MVIKKVEDMDFYDLLGLPLHASPEEVERAYLRAVATYHEEALASYRVFSREERHFILERVEAAFQTLSDPGRRKAYDEMILPSRPESQQKAYYRKSTARLEIEDASEDSSLWGTVRSLFSRKFKKNDRKTQNITQDQELGLEADGWYYHGEYLKLVRENRGLSREEIAKASGLSEDLVRAIEEENYNALPRAKDPSSLLRLYAGSLGLNAENGRRAAPNRPVRRT